MYVVFLSITVILCLCKVVIKCNKGFPLAPSSSHDIYTPTPSKLSHTIRMLPVMEDQHGEHHANEKHSAKISQHSISEFQYDSSHSLHSHTSGEPLDCLESPLVKAEMQNSTSLSALSSGIGSQTNTQSSLSDASSGRSSNVSPELDNTYVDRSQTVLEVAENDTLLQQLESSEEPIENERLQVLVEENQTDDEIPEVLTLMRDQSEKTAQNDEENLDPRTSVYSFGNPWYLDVHLNYQ